MCVVAMEGGWWQDVIKIKWNSKLWLLCYFSMYFHLYTSIQSEYPTREKNNRGGSTLLQLAEAVVRSLYLVINVQAFFQKAIPYYFE